MKVKLSKSFTLLGFGSVFISMCFTHINANEWIKTYRVGNSCGKHMQQTSDGGYIIVTKGKLSLLKTNSLGDSIWAKCYEDTIDMHGYCVRQTKDGGYIVTGELSTPYNKLLLMKTDSLGDTLWTKIYYGPQEGEGGQSVLQTEDEGYIIVGSTRSYDPGPGYDVWLVRTDSLGDTLWTRTYGGKQGCDYGYWIEKTYDGGYIIAAMNWSSAPHDIWLIKIDSLGNTLWTKLYGSERSDFPSCVKQTSDSGYIIVGHAQAYGYRHIWLIKTNSYGDTLWTKFFLPEGAGIWEAWGECVQETYDGGYITTGSLIDSGYVKFFLTKTDLSGNILWTKKFPTNKNEAGGYCVLQTSDSGYTATGYMDYGSFAKLCILHTYGSVAVEEKALKSKSICLSVYPNPITCEAQIRYELPAKFEPQLKLYDISGREVKNLLDSFQEKGSYRIVWNGRNNQGKEVKNGIYFCIMESDKKEKRVKKILFLK